MTRPGGYPLRITPEQRRRVQAVGASLFAILLIVLGVVVAFGDNSKDSVDTVASTSNDRTTTTATPGVVVSTTTTPPTTAASTGAATTSTTRARRVTTTTATTEPPPPFQDAPDQLECAHTTPAEPTVASDWAEYWTTEPEPNDYLDIWICVADNSPKVNTTVKLYLLAQDADAKIGQERCDIFVSWTSNSGTGCREQSAAPPAQPKPLPPEESSGEVRMTFAHVYDEPGEWIVDVSVWSGPNSPERHPYASYNSIELRLNVHR